MTPTRLLLTTLACIAASASLWAREPDGALGLIRTPNNGVPAIIAPGAAFDAVLTEEASLRLVGDGGVHSLETTWTPLPGGLQRGLVQTQAALPPGAYVLEAETKERKDANQRSVYVLDAFPESYGFAHVTDVHIGTTRHPRRPEDIFADILNLINLSEAAFALITGDLTESGEEEEFRLFIETLDACLKPTFVVPGNHDRQGRNYERFFGPSIYAFQFGDDGYLAFDTKDFLVADEMGAQDGWLHYYRRQLRPSRWSIGFTHRYELTMGMRAQLILFVDDPLDCLLYGHFHREPGEQDGIPWGDTPIVMTPAAVDGNMRPVLVDAQGVHPGESVKAAEIQTNAN